MFFTSALHSGYFQQIIKKKVVIPAQAGVLKQYVNLAKVLRFPIKLGMTTREYAVFGPAMKKIIYFSNLSNIKTTI
jgi:hypothetical protein